jgi:glycosyltransferase involved in cell wall biosynthesis
VVVPAYNEERLIAKTLTTMPAGVDAVIVVNDGSTDHTSEVIASLAAKDPRIDVITHEANRGLGQSLIDGYVRSRTRRYDVTVVMAGDAQMSPDDLPAVLRPVVEGRADYAKGNRLLVSDVAEHMPFHRLVGNAGLTFLTKFATGYWHVIDPQCGYTAISRRALAAIPIERMTQGYGYNADILNMLNVRNFRVADVEVQPVYGEERSKIKLRKYIPKVSALLVRLFFRRLIHKYLIRNFNPLSLSYIFGLFLLFFVSLPLGGRLLYMYYATEQFPHTTMLSLMFVTIAGIQILLSAIHYDMEDNRHLCVHEEPPVAAADGSGDRGVA